MPFASCRAWLPLAALSAMTACAPALAGTHWLCSLSEDAVRLVCVADVDPRLEAADAVAVPTARVRGTAFPLDARQTYRIDLWSPPSDADWLALLARSTICYRSPGCTVWVAPWGRGPSVAAALRAER